VNLISCEILRKYEKLNIELCFMHIFCSVRDVSSETLTDRAVSALAEDIATLPLDRLWFFCAGAA